jgi:hypothetical protein
MPYQLKIIYTIRSQPSIDSVGFLMYLHSANVFALKVKRQLKKTSTSLDREMNAVLFPVQRVFKRRLNKEWKAT